MIKHKQDKSSNHKSMGPGKLKEKARAFCGPAQSDENLIIHSPIGRIGTYEFR